jgi:probable O-glycosylation ligase (exosortase A-associated)
MRDLFFLAILPFMLYPMIRRPFIALGMWIWTAMFFPNAWLYGIGVDIRYNLVFTGVTIFGYLLLKDKPRIQLQGIGALVLLFFAWTTLSTVFTIGVPEVAWDIWSRFFKVVLLFVLVVFIIEKKLHIDFFLWCIVLSIGFYGGLEALKYVASGGGHKIAGFSGHVLGDRNELALAFVITLPICYYLLSQYGKDSRILRVGLIGLMGLMVAAVIGTQSRGGFIALLGLAAYLFIKSDRKVLVFVLSAVLVLVLSHFVSDEWVTRMDTISEADEDGSFLGRLVAWKQSFILAMQNPVFGGGFKSLESRTVWLALSQDFFSYPFFYTGDALPNPYLPRAAHSVYFQVLAEHGFGGLAIYLAMLLAVFRRAGLIAKEARKHVETAWVAMLATMMQLCVFAFCLGGAGLSFAYFEVMYAVAGIVLVLKSRIMPALVPAALHSTGKLPRPLQDKRSAAVV